RRSSARALSNSDAWAESQHENQSIYQSYRFFADTVGAAWADETTSLSRTKSRSTAQRRSDAATKRLYGMVAEPGKNGQKKFGSNAPANKTGDGGIDARGSHQRRLETLPERSGFG